MEKGSLRLLDTYGNISVVAKGHVPAFIYRGKVPVIFDPGISAFGPLYYRKLRSLVSDNDAPLLMLLTHSHFDHCGAASYLQKKYPRAKLGASVRAAEVLQKTSAVDLIRRFNAEYEHQMADELQGEDTTFAAIAVDLPLQEGDAVEVGDGRAFRVIETPGHTRDCVSYFDPDSGVLVAGEAAGVPEGEFIHSVFLSNYEQYIHSIEKLRALNAEALCIAHAGIITGRNGISAYLQASRAAAEGYRTKIEHLLEKFNGDQERLVDVIVAEEYDSRPHHIVNRNPFITNLRAKVNAIQKLRGNKEECRIHDA